MRTLAGVGAVALVAMIACVGDDPVAGAVGAKSDGGATDGGEADAHVDTLAALVITAAPVEVVRAGEPVSVDVRLSWVGAPTEVRIGFEGLPIGVEGSSATVSPGSLSAMLSISARESAAYGAASFTVVATSTTDSSKRTTIQVPMFTRGVPGSLDTTFGEGGAAKAPQGSLQADAVRFNDDGSFVVAGSGGGGTSHDVVLGSYDADGRPSGLGPENVVSFSRTAYSPFRFLPGSIERANDRYRVGYAGGGDGAYEPGVATALVADGSLSFAPFVSEERYFDVIPVPTNSAWAIPNGEGAIGLVASPAEIHPRQADGDVDARWATRQIGPKAAGAYSGSRIVHALFTETRMILFVNLTGVASIDSWSGYLLVSRPDGAMMARAAVLMPDAAVARRDGSFVTMVSTGACKTINASGGVQSSTRPLFDFTPSGWRPSLAESSDGTLFALATEPGATHRVRLQMVEPGAAVASSALSLQAVDAAEDGAIEPYTVQAVHRDPVRRRLTVYYHVWNPSGLPAAGINTSWLIRRYWL